MCLSSIYFFLQSIHNITFGLKNMLVLKHKKKDSKKLLLKWFPWSFYRGISHSMHKNFLSAIGSILYISSRSSSTAGIRNLSVIVLLLKSLKLTQKHDMLSASQLQFQLSACLSHIKFFQFSTYIYFIVIWTCFFTKLDLHSVYHPIIMHLADDSLRSLSITGMGNLSLIVLLLRAS